MRVLNKVVHFPDNLFQPVIFFIQVQAACETKNMANQDVIEHKDNYFLESVGWLLVLVAWLLGLSACLHKYYCRGFYEIWMEDRRVDPINFWCRSCLRDRSRIFFSLYSTLWDWWVLGGGHFYSHGIMHGAWWKERVHLGGWNLWLSTMQIFRSGNLRLWLSSSGRFKYFHAVGWRRNQLCFCFLRESKKEQMLVS